MSVIFANHKLLREQGKITPKEYKRLERLKASKRGIGLYHYFERKYAKRPAGSRA